MRNRMRTKSEPMQPLLSPRSTELLVGGLTRLSTVDFPDRLAAVIFCQGCPWRCEYCHNPHLLPMTGDAALGWTDVLEFLSRRRGLLDAVVFTGGEPTRQAGLAAAIAEVKDLGFEIALHTAGCYPDGLGQVLPLLDWVAIDIKAPFASYHEVTGIAGSGAKARASITKVLEYGLPCEFHSTVGPALLRDDQLIKLAESLAELGVRHFILQQCRAPEGYVHPIPEESVDRIRPLFETLRVRRSG